MPEPGRGEMNFRADGAIYVRIAARNREALWRVLTRRSMIRRLRA
jgi:hypothetical protein